MKFIVKLKVFDRIYDLAWSDNLPNKVMGHQTVLAWLKKQAETYRLRRISVAPIPAHFSPDDRNISFLGFCEYYNQEENPSTELEVIGEIPPLGNASDDIVY